MNRRALFSLLLIASVLLFGFFGVSLVELFPRETRTLAAFALGGLQGIWYFLLIAYSTPRQHCSECGLILPRFRPLTRVFHRRHPRLCPHCRTLLDPTGTKIEATPG